MTEILIFNCFFFLQYFQPEPEAGLDPTCDASIEPELTRDYENQAQTQLFQPEVTHRSKGNFASFRRRRFDNTATSKISRYNLTCS